MNEYLEEKKKQRENIVGIIFIIWFIASMFLFFIVPEDYIVMIFGQYFFFFGLFVFCHVEEFVSRCILSLFMIIGLGCMVVPFLMMHPDILSVEIIWDSVIPLLLLVLFGIVGIGLIIVTLVRNAQLKKVCTYEIVAHIVRYESSRDDGTTTYCPVYGFWYNGKDWEVSNNVYSNVGLKDIGSREKLIINPENPEEFMVSGSIMSFLLVIFGIALLSIVIPLIIYFINNNEFIR